jgi:hypothetical protein
MGIRRSSELPDEAGGHQVGVSFFDLEPLPLSDDTDVVGDVVTRAETPREVRSALILFLAAVTREINVGVPEVVTNLAEQVEILVDRPVALERGIDAVELI